MIRCALCGGEIIRRNAGMHRAVITLAQEWVHRWPWHRHAPVLPRGVQ